jgi:hypothetical protein
MIPHGVPQGSMLGLFLFFIYINNFPVIWNMVSTSIRFADDKSVIISNSDPVDFQNNLSEVLKQLNRCRITNLLSLNFSETEFINFEARNICGLIVKVEYNNKSISNLTHSRFLGINVENILSWKSHMNQLIPELRSACYALRVIKQCESKNINDGLLCVFSCNYDLQNHFWGRSSHSINIFYIQKKVIRIIAGTSNRDSCRDLFKILEIIPLQSQYIYALVCFITDDMDQYQFILDIHNRNTRQGSNLYQPPLILLLYQRGTYYMGIKVFNNLSSYLKDLHINRKQFKLVLKDYLYTHSCYTLEECYSLWILIISWYNILINILYQLYHLYVYCVLFNFFPFFFVI